MLTRNSFASFVRELMCTRTFTSLAIRSVVSGIALSYALFDGIANADDWPISRGNATSTGVASGKMATQPKVIWEYTPEKSGFEGTPIIAEGRLFIGDVEGTIHALIANTGKVEWTRTTKNGFLTAGAYRDGLLVLGDFDGKIYGLKTKDGEVAWEYELDQQIASGGNFFGENVLLTSEGGSMIALDMKSGKLQWDYSTGDQLRSGPTIWKNYALLGGCDGRLHKIDLVAGAAAGDGIPLDGPTGSTPAVIDNLAVVPTQSGTVLAFDLENGNRIWEFKDEERSPEIRSSPAVIYTGKETATDAGLVVLTTRNRRVLGIDIKTGAFVWEAILRKRSDASVVICDGRVWAVSTDGMVYAFDLYNGEMQWSYQLAGQIIAAPAIANDRLYVATEKGSVVCFGAPN